MLDLQAQYETIREKVLAAVGEVLDSQVCIGGPKVAELERKVASLCDCAYGVGVSSGTDALLCSMMSLEIGPGDEVITTPFTFFATAGSIARLGAKPVFIDIDSRTYNLNPAAMESAITARTKAVIPVHLFGQTADMDAIISIAERHGLAVIEDAAQAISATYKGHRAGSMGTLGCLSFFPSKNLGGVGDGGMVVTNDEALYEHLLVMRNHGSKPKYWHPYLGGNFRLDPIQAAVLLVKLPYLDGWCEARRRNAAYYDERLGPLGVCVPLIKPGCTSVYNQYVIRVERRDELKAHLAQRGIQTEIYYPSPLHVQPCFASLGYAPGSFPESVKASGAVLALPIYPELPSAHREFVADAIASFL
jgi:dTDP-4-amino-4,6-dideoxygalactose transaminase